MKSLAALLLYIGLWVAAVSAAPVTYEFTGSFTLVIGKNSLFPTAAVGDKFIYRVTVDASLPSVYASTGLEQYGDHYVAEQPAGFGSVIGSSMTVNGVTHDLAFESGRTRPQQFLEVLDGGPFIYNDANSSRTVLREGLDFLAYPSNGGHVGNSYLEDVQVEYWQEYPQDTAISGPAGIVNSTALPLSLANQTPLTVHQLYFVEQPDPNVPATQLTGDIESLTIQASTSSEPAPFGSFARILVAELGHLVDSTHGGAGQFRATSYYFNTQGGIQSGQGSALQGLAVSAFSEANHYNGAARSLAYSTFRNDNADPVTLKVSSQFISRFHPAPFNLPMGHLRSGAGIHVVDTTEFLAAQAKSKKTVQQFLIGGYSLAQATEPGTAQAALVNTLKPAALAEGSVLKEDDFSDPPVSYPVVTNTFTVAPGAEFTVFFDAATFAATATLGGATGGGDVTCNAVLPSDNIFVDAAGQPVAGLTAVRSFPATAALSSGTFRGLSGSGNGSLGMLVTKTGVCTGAAVLGSITYRLTGKFDSQGNFVGVARPKLALDLHLIRSGGAEGDYFISGTLGAEAFNIRHAATGANGLNGVAVGGYTLFLKPTSTESTIPQGTGYARLTVAATGAVSISGKLPEGTAFSSSGALVIGADARPQFPIYSSSGTTHSRLLRGTVIFQAADRSDCSGTLHWTRPSSPNTYYTSPFDTSLEVSGFNYVPPPAGTSPLPFSEGSVQLTGAGVAGTYSEPVTSGKTIAALSPNLHKFKFTVHADTGLMTGSFLHPATQRVVSFAGALGQNLLDPRAEGFFLSNPLSGRIAIVPAP